MDLSQVVQGVNSSQTSPDGGRFAVEINTVSVSSVPSVPAGNVSVSDQKRRVEMKQTLDKKKSVVKKPHQPARRASLRDKNGKPADPARPAAKKTAPPAPPREDGEKEELVADHELDILLDSFENETFVGLQPIEPSSHGEDPTATDELWRRLHNTAWLRNPESTTDEGNSSTVAHRS
jgi:hypothetical protein